MTQAVYQSSVGENYVIVGNDVILTCHVPSFMSDLVVVHSWVDSEGTQYHQGPAGNFNAPRYTGGGREFIM